MYQNQFQKYQPEPFLEQDVPPHVMNDEGPVIAPWVCKAALERSVAKIFYHSGFEEYQPSALQAATDIASDIFQKIGQTMKSYMETPKLPESTIKEEKEASSQSQRQQPPNLSSSSTSSSSSSEWKPAYSQQDVILHTLAALGTDVEGLETYIKDDVDRFGSKLATTHERLRSMFAELLRPALVDGGEDGSNAFADGSDQFVVGDFAEDIDEDFFGFKEMGLDKEFGLATLSVPLHLLQGRMYNAAQAQNTRYVYFVFILLIILPNHLVIKCKKKKKKKNLTLFSSATQSVTLFPPPPPYPRITTETVSSQIGLVQGFFRSKLQANNDEPLSEDLELPPKHRHRPRLPASGKITGPTPTPATTAAAASSSTTTAAAATTTTNTSPQKRPQPSSQQSAATAGQNAGPASKKAKKNNGLALDTGGPP